MIVLATFRMILSIFSFLTEKVVRRNENIESQSAHIASLDFHLSPTSVEKLFASEHILTLKLSMTNTDQ
jgi:hypothetical protein